MEQVLAVLLGGPMLVATIAGVNVYLNRTKPRSRKVNAVRL